MKEETKEEKRVTDLEARLKKQHGDVTKIVVSGDSVYTAYLREPTLVELDSIAYTLAKSPNSTISSLFKTLFVGGDKELVTLVDRPSYVLAVREGVTNVISVFKAESTKL